MAARYQAGGQFDHLSQMFAGMDSSVPPVLLPRNQLAYGRNTTERTGYVLPRPAYQQIALTLSGFEQELFEERIWQGAAFYRPDSGAESMIASVGGRLFQVTPGDQSQQAATVTDITPISGGASTSATQAWLWQSERWLIRQDGEATPMLFDGNTSRYAKTGIVLGTLAADAAIPAQGASVQVTLVSEFTGQWGQSVNVFSPSGINRGRFQVNPGTGTGGFQVRLVNVSDTEGALHDNGENIEVVGNYSGNATNGVTIPNGGTGVIGLTPQFSGPLNSVLHWGLSGDFTFRVIAINGSNVTLRDLKTNGTQKVIFSGDPFQLTPSSPNQLVAITTGSFNAPDVGGEVIVPVDRLYTGAEEQYVSVGGQSYRIYASSPAPSTSVFLLNIDNPEVGTLVTGSTLNELPELPTGRMGAYGMGRNWLALADGISFVASDLVGSSSGSPANNYRDAVLNVTENNYLAGGGTFRLPGAGVEITAMIFPATLDASLGQGALQVFTRYNVFSCNTPVDRSEWQDLESPILTQSLISNGSESHYGTIITNGDAMFRSIDGIRSLILGRRDFIERRGNTPISEEVNRVLDGDNRQLLKFASAIVFDNRMLMTATPTQDQLGVYHSNLIALNLDPSSSLRETKPDIYDGIWDGLNVLQLVTGRFNGLDRAFAFCYNTTDQKIELHEILTSASEQKSDDGDTPIESMWELPVVFNQTERPDRQLLRLIDGEIMVEDVRGQVEFEVYYRPDYDPNWHAWYSWTIPSSPLWQPRMGLGEPAPESDPATERPYRVGYHFQVKIVRRGYCRFMGINVQAVNVPQSEFAGPMRSSSST